MLIYSLVSIKHKNKTEQTENWVLSNLTESESEKVLKGLSDMFYVLFQGGAKNWNFQRGSFLNWSRLVKAVF